MSVSTGPVCCVQQLLGSCTTSSSDSQTRLYPYNLSQGSSSILKLPSVVLISFIFWKRIYNSTEWYSSFLFSPGKGTNISLKMWFHTEFTYTQIVKYVTLLCILNLDNRINHSLILLQLTCNIDSNPSKISLHLPKGTLSTL